MSFVTVANVFLMALFILVAGWIMIQIAQRKQFAKNEVRAHRLIMMRAAIDEMPPDQRKVAAMERWREDVAIYADEMKRKDMVKNAGSAVRLIVDNEI
ncbi:hypothetical protein [Shewanella algae]|uniref:hypothetical protein n=1 Tax=Shewanella algae TaxID=38313 RepID=UPI0031F4B1CD